jgi:hypothetical protein
MPPYGGRRAEAMTAKTKLETQEFTLILLGVSELTDELQGRLLEAGCDDASLWSEGDTVCLDFSREAESLGDAIGSAVKDVMGAGLAVARVVIETA